MVSTDNCFTILNTQIILFQITGFSLKDFEYFDFFEELRVLKHNTSVFVYN